MPPENVLDYLLPGHPRQEVVDNGPLVEPAGRPLRGSKLILPAELQVRLRQHMVEHGVVQLQKA